MPDPTTDRGRKKILVPQLTYKECCERGESCWFFKWIPESAASFEELVSMNDDPCDDNGCHGLQQAARTPVTAAGTATATAISHNSGPCRQTCGPEIANPRKARTGWSFAANRGLDGREERNERLRSTCRLPCTPSNVGGIGGGINAIGELLFVFEEVKMHVFLLRLPAWTPQLMLSWRRRWRPFSRSGEAAEAWNNAHPPRDVDQNR